MTHQEKADEIYNSVKGFRVKNHHRKKCALVVVDYLIIHDPTMIPVDNESYTGCDADEAVEYYQEVRKLILKK